MTSKVNIYFIFLIFFVSGEFSYSQSINDIYPEKTII